MEFFAQKGCLKINPITYVHLINIVDIFLRPIAAQGDLQMLQLEEQRHILTNMKCYHVAKKKGNNLTIFYDYVVVFSGSYLYFYNQEDFKVIRAINGIINGKNIESFDLNGVKYEEQFLVKGCYKIDQLKNQADILRVILKNSQKEECILELYSQEDLDNLTTLIQERVAQIDQFLNKDTIKFGDFQKIRADKVTQDENLTQQLIENQLDMKHNFDYLCQEDIYQKDQSYDIRISQISIILEGVSKFNTKTFFPCASLENQMIFSCQQPKQIGGQSMNEKNQDRFQFLLLAKDFNFGFSFRYFDKNMDISLESVQIIDRSQKLDIIEKIQKESKHLMVDSNIFDDYVAEIDNQDRYQTLLKSESTHSNKNIVKVQMRLQDLRSPRFQDNEMEFDIQISQVVLNYIPIQINRLLRVLRFYRYPDTEIQAKSTVIKQSLKFQLNQDQQIQEDNKIVIELDKQKKRISCQQDKQIQISVKVKVEQIKLVCVHSQNNTYPLITVKAKDLQFNFFMYADHDDYEIQLGVFKIFDNTKYPNTLSPTKSYVIGSQAFSQLIIGFQNNCFNEAPLIFQMKSFHFPKDFCCPLQTCTEKNKQFNSLVFLQMKSLKINYMQENILRISDYFLYQLLESLSDTDPYQELKVTLQNKLNPFFNEQQEIQFKNLEVQWEKQVVGLEIKIDNPLIVLKDRQYLDKSMSLDLGIILISNMTEKQLGRWKSDKNKEVWVHKMSIKCQNLNIQYIKKDRKILQVLKPFDLQIDYEQVNSSPQIQDSFNSKQIDFEDLTIEDRVKIQTIDGNHLNVNLSQEAYTYLMRCIDLNINFTDNQIAQFQFQTWNSYDTLRVYQNEIEIQRKFKNVDLKRRSTSIDFSSFSLSCLMRQKDFNEQKIYIEMVFTKVMIEFQQFVDLRTFCSLQSHQFFILYKDNIDSQIVPISQKNLLDINFKQLILGPLSSHSNIETNKEFYNQNLKQIDIEQNLKMMMKIEADGSKKGEVYLNDLKLFVKIDYLFMIQSFFQDGLPTYDNAHPRDKPSNFSSDQASYPKFDLIIQLKDSLIVLEQLLFFRSHFANKKQSQILGQDQQSSNFISKTISFQGDVNIHFLKEKENQIKEDMIRNYDKNFFEEQKQMVQIDSSQKSNTKYQNYIQNLNVQQFEIMNAQTFLCYIQDINEPLFNNKSQLILEDNDEQKECINQEFKLQKLDGQHFKDIWRRQLIINPTFIAFSFSDIIELEISQNEFGVFSKNVKDDLKNKNNIEVHKYDYFKYFKKMILNLQMIQMNLTLNDITIIRGNIKKFLLMQENYENLNTKNNKVVGQEFQDSSNINNYKKESKVQIEFEKIYNEDGQIQSNQMDDQKGSSQGNSKYSSSQNLDDNRYIDYNSEDIDSDEVDPDQKDIECDFSSEEEGSSQVDQISRQSINAFNMSKSINSKEQNQGKVANKNQNARSQVILHVPKNKFTQENKKNQSTIISENHKAQHNNFLNIPNLNRKYKNLKRYFEKEEQSQNNILQIKSKERQGGQYQIQIKSCGLKFIIINDSESNFVPIFSINSSPFEILQMDNIHLSSIHSKFCISINFFNIKIGRWEPAVEKFILSFIKIEDIIGRISKNDLLFESIVNINITEKFVENIHQSYKQFCNGQQEYLNFEKKVVRSLLNSVNQLKNYSIAPQDEEELQIKQKEVKNQNEEISIEQQPRLSVVDRKLHQDLLKFKFQKQQVLQYLNNDGMPENQATKISNNLTQEVITPYVILNKTDLTIVVQRLLKKKANKNDVNQIMQSQIMESDQESHKQMNKKVKLQNIYKIGQGQIEDYMVDYNDETANMYQDRKQYSFDEDELIHYDHIGEYKSEYVKIKFDKTSAELSLNRELFEDNKEIKQVDLNEVGYFQHYLRTGANIEKIFYGSKLLDCKKVFTLRSQYQIVNFTGYDYLVCFQLHGKIKLMKYIESGDSIPLSRRFDETSIQIKIIDDEIISDLKKKESSLGIQNKNGKNIRYKLDEEQLFSKDGIVLKQISDMRSPDFKFKNWSNLIHVKILKEKLALEQSSYLSNGISKFTFLKKTKSEIMVQVKNEEAIDINLMPPIIIRNCLPFSITFKFVDSSDVQQTLVLEKEEEKNLFCFSLSKTILTDIEIQDFEKIKGYKLVNLDKNKFNRESSKILIQDRYGRQTYIYTSILRDNAGQRIIFFCKKILIDSIDSDLQYFYKRPNLIVNKDQQVIQNMIPFVNIGVLRQKIYIIPEDKDKNQKVYASLQGEYTRNDCVQIDLETISSQFEFSIKSKTNIKHKYSYYSEVYLATQHEYIYTKITNVCPYHIIVNQSKHSIVIEQQKFEEIIQNNQQIQQEHIPLILEPGQRQAFNFQNIDIKNIDTNELLHIKILDERVPIPFQEQENQKIQIRKRYQWSSPFNISSLQQFTLKIDQVPLDISEIGKLKFLKPGKPETEEFVKYIYSPNYLKIMCKSDIVSKNSSHGSIYVVIKDEIDELCEYMITNKSRLCTFVYNQYISNKRSDFQYNDQQFKNKDSFLKYGESQRYAWASVLHDKILKISFSHPNNILQKYSLVNLTQKQVFRTIKYQDKKNGQGPSEILVPLDKIGHNEEICIKLPNQNNFIKINISITTNSFTKFLTIEDVDEFQNDQIIQNDEDIQMQEALSLESFKLFRTEQDIKNGILRKQIEICMRNVCISLIHKKNELITIFISNIKAEIEETFKNTMIKFQVGYMQVDNQNQSETGFAVIVRPRDLQYDLGKVRFILEKETQKEKEEREKLGLAMLTDETARMFQFEILLNNKESQNKKNNVFYIDKIVFLLQTLVIKLQFSHFLKIAGYFYNISKILNQSFTQVHYLFEQDIEKFIDSNLINSNDILDDNELQNVEFIKNQQQQMLLFAGNEQQEEEEELQIINYQDQALIQRIERLKNFKKQDAMVGSKIKQQAFKKKIDAQKMSNTDSNWQLSSKINSQSKWRIFIKNYQSSPVEMLVSAINENLKNNQKQQVENQIQAIEKNTNKKIQQEQQIISDNLNTGINEIDETKEKDEVIRLMSVRDENLASKFLYFSNFEDMLFQMNGLNVSNVFGDGRDVLNQLYTYHQESFKYNLLLMAGSSNLIGNPSKFINGVGTGVSDFFVKPYQGMKNGTIVTAAQGFGEGSKSFILNAVMAPVGAVSKIGNSISKGALAFSFDDKYIEQKNEKDRQNKPVNIGDGLVKGFSNAGSSIWSGVSGVFTKPIEGAKEDGVGGFFVGIGKGAAGFVSKTVSGTVDIVAKTSEGLDNQAQRSKKNLISNKIRNTRIFYEDVNLIRNFQAFNANQIFSLRQIYKFIDFNHIYEIFPHFEQTIKKKIINGYTAYEFNSNIFVLTKYHLLQFKLTSIYFKDHFAQNIQALQKQSQPTIQNHSNQIQEVQADLDIEEIRKQFISLLYNGLNYKEKLDMNGTGTQIKLKNAYLLKYLDFVEVLNKNVIFIGWRMDQSQNLLQDDQYSITQKKANQTQNQKSEQKMNIEKPQRLTQEQMQKLQADLFLQYFEQIEKMNQLRKNNQIEEIKKDPKLYIGDHFMVLNFEDIIDNNQEHQFFNTNNFTLRLQYHLLRIKTQIAKESIRLKNMEATKEN